MEDVAGDAGRDGSSAARADGCVLELFPAPAPVCGWCRGPIPSGSRRDAKYCGQGCRQSAWRFHRGAPVHLARATAPIRVAYADPPYPGKAGYYRNHPDGGRGEVDHRELLEALADGYPDGWALSTSAEALPDVLGMAPAGVRVAAWVRGERPTRSRWPLSAWEPVLVYGGRPTMREPAARRVDALVHHARPRLTDPARVVGAKPAAFCWWLLELLGLQVGDELVDLFPGSGGVSRAWAYLSALAAAGPDASAGAGEGRRVGVAGGGDG